MTTNPAAAQTGKTKSGEKHWCPQMTVPFDNIQEPGAYYFHPTGALLRVPSEAINPGHSPTMNLCCSEECYCTKISDNPWLPVNKAREICANSDFNVTF
jgi:hypothetical protein